MRRPQLIRKWRLWPSTQERENDLDREIRSHLELETEEQQEYGLPSNEARYAAQRAFGNRSLVKEDTRAMWGWNWLEAFVQDVRYGVRLLRRSPAECAEGRHHQREDGSPLLCKPHRPADRAGSRRRA